MRDERRDRPKKSWREVDQLRNRGGSRQIENERASSPAQVSGQKSYRAALERAFEAGKLGELARTFNRPADVTAKAAGPAMPGPAVANGQETTQNGQQALCGPTTMANATAATPPQSVAPIPAAAPHRVDPERESRLKLLAKIRDAEGKEPVSRAIDGYLAKHGNLPDDYEVLTKALSHKNDDIVGAALEKISSLLGKEKPRRGRTLAGQLRFIEETHGDPEIRRAAAEVRARL